MGDKIGPPRQNLADGADHAGNVLDTVDDQILFICKDDIAVLSHDLNDQFFAAKVAHFVQVLNVQMDDPFKARLGNVCDAAVLQVLSKKHAKAGGSHRGLFICFGQIQKGEGGVCGS